MASRPLPRRGEGVFLPPPSLPCRGARSRKARKPAQENIMTAIARPSGRTADALRSVTLEAGAAKFAEGSCLVKFGDTHVLVTASLDLSVPPWLRGTGQGWVTAEYGMLPRATAERTAREAARGKQTGRTVEIQQVVIDCDVLQADGGTRTAAITGAWVALSQCFDRMTQRGMLAESPITDQVAGISCGLYRGLPVLDLDYAEDREAEADANFVLTGTGGIVEVQATAEDSPFTDDQFAVLFALARKGVAELCTLQRAALGKG
jgi:ribonuclease PH